PERGIPWEDANGLLPGRGPPGLGPAGFGAAGFGAPGFGAGFASGASSAWAAGVSGFGSAGSPLVGAAGFGAPGLGADVFGADCSSAGFSAAGSFAAGFAFGAAVFFFGAGSALGIASLTLLCTGASMVEDADLTNSPSSSSFAKPVFLSTPSSSASSCTRTRDTPLLSRSSLDWVGPLSCGPSLGTHRGSIGV